MNLVEHPTGHYSFLPGIAPYSCGVVASPGYEIVHVRFRKPVNYRPAFDQIAQFLESVKRPKSSLCAVELRSPSPFTFGGFAELNADYAEILKSWELFVHGINPVARTNVAPGHNAPDTVVIYGFSFTRPTENKEILTFVVAGGGELPEGRLDEKSIVARGDVTENGLLFKSRFVLQLMHQRLTGLGADWKDVTATNIYTIHPMDVVIKEVLNELTQPAGLHGYQWYFSRPPIVEIEYEMDLRGYCTEMFI
ncbi:MAG: hypothetical protein RJA81_627 [Planctomycetota bacterium]|jgi:hypothetical protein